MPPAADPSCHGKRKLPSGYRVYHPLAVRDVLNQLSEAEVTGDDQVVRTLVAKIQNRTLFPAKVLIFHEDARPGYYGTWTRSSRIIGPRRPLAKDLLVFDYGYDSGEEWEEEPVGEDVADDDDDDDDGDDGADSDADSWLVDDDEEPEILSLGDMDSITPPDLFDSGLPPPLPQLPKRKSNDDERKGAKKRKVVVPLVPFMKGPCWEDNVGACSYDHFQPYQIRLFNGKYPTSTIDDALSHHLNSCRYPLPHRSLQIRLILQRRLQSASQISASPAALHDTRRLRDTLRSPPIEPQRCVNPKQTFLQCPLRRIHTYALHLQPSSHVRGTFSSCPFTDESRRQLRNCHSSSQEGRPAAGAPC